MVNHAKKNIQITQKQPTWQRSNKIVQNLQGTVNIGSQLQKLADIAAREIIMVTGFEKSHIEL